jgi:hypothetical protein
LTIICNSSVDSKKRSQNQNNISAPAGPATLQTTHARFENKDIRQNNSFLFAIEEQNKQTPKRLGDKRSPLLLLTSKKRSFLHSPGAKSIQKRKCNNKESFLHCSHQLLRRR